MDTVKVSPKFQVVIPKKVREGLKLEPGQELSIYILDGTIRLPALGLSRIFAVQQKG